MIDRERKQHADRERRERIRNGTWKFPKGGDADASLGLSSKTTLTAQRGSPSAYMPLSQANPKPAPHSIIPVASTTAQHRGAAPPPAPSPSRALVVRPHAPAHQPVSTFAGIAGGRRVPTGYDPGTYPIKPPYRPEAMPSQLMHAIAEVERRRREDRAEFEARISALEATAARQEPMATNWGDAAYRFVVLMNGLSEHGRKNR